MSDVAKGFWAVIAACLIWGLSSIYYKFLDAVPPIEVLAHRTLWSMVFFGIILALKGRLGEVRAALSARSGRGALLIFAAALAISLNWFIFIWSVQSGFAVQASLGYYILPIVSVVLGRLVFGEALRPVQWAAVLLAALAVGVLTLGLGVAPWISLVLAFSFGAYGVIKRGVTAGPMVSVFTEVLMLSPIALTVLLGFHFGWWGTSPAVGVFGTDWQMTALLVFSGVLTGMPLLLFSYAAQRVRLATLGQVQYLNPTVQLVVAAFLFKEPVTIWHVIALGLIWCALALYSSVSLRQHRAEPRPPAALGGNSPG
ncbi:RarD protein [Thioclava dalianensis]|uniref:RarD protein n=1 Tax=Thioclava dalianensis TaxID=1185766 RepID=A0A074TKW2_9RHOB|nr:EamA family transporter RarD [Thioclava dalianensis]KEP70780.1 RarD protein [Thioclava dalianensis]SFN10562.1 chloramphenicol-sensitive protein RarD [Thioclava dalianensis]